MKILMALDYYKPNLSGLSLYAERLAEGLSERGHAVTILTHRHRKDLPREERQGKIRVLRAPVLGKIGKALISPALLAAARREISRADILHLHAPLVPAVPLALLSRGSRVPLIVTYHCDLRTPPGALQRVLESVARASQNFALDRAAAIVTNTEDYARNTAPLAERPGRVRSILPPVAEPPESELTEAQARERFAIRGEPVILFLGRFAEEKGLFHLLAAFQEVRRALPGAALVLAGEKESVPGESVGERLAPYLADPSSGVVATGPVPPEDISTLFNVADVLALPSTNSTESFGVVQVEAMLSGVPVVASDLPGVRQPVSMTGMGEIARAGDARELAEKLLAVLRSPGKYLRPREEIRRTFPLDRTIGQYEALYEEVRRA